MSKVLQQFQKFQNRVKILVPEGYGENVLEIPSLNQKCSRGFKNLICSDRLSIQVFHGESTTVFFIAPLLFFLSAIRKTVVDSSWHQILFHPLDLKWFVLGAPEDLCNKLGT